MFSILKGVIWLLIATAAGILPMASSASFLAHLLLTHRFMSAAGIHYFESERYCYPLSSISMKDTKLNTILGISSVQPRAFLFITS
jgi:hypothetical protein